jgi:hypothetical protein
LLVIFLAPTLLAELGFSLRQKARWEFIVGFLVCCSSSELFMEHRICGRVKPQQDETFKANCKKHGQGGGATTMKDPEFAHSQPGSTLHDASSASSATRVQQWAPLQGKDIKLQAREKGREVGQSQKAPAHVEVVHSRCYCLDALPHHGSANVSATEATECKATKTDQMDKHVDDGEAWAAQAH